MGFDMVFPELVEIEQPQQFSGRFGYDPDPFPFTGDAFCLARSEFWTECGENKCLLFASACQL
jgi:hypothetical protein